VIKKILLLSLILIRGLLAEEREMVIVIPSYNNEAWYSKNLLSAFEQNYNKFRILYINDCSKDLTGEKVAEFALLKRPDSFCVVTFDDNSLTDIEERTEKFKEIVNQNTAFFTLVNNTSRCGALENLYRAIYSCQDDHIIVTLDGDDWLLDNDVLKRLNKVYNSSEIWMTHGRFIEYPHGGTQWCEPVPTELVQSNDVRKFKCPSHLRTFYAWIFKKIALEDLLYEEKFFPMTWDMAMMYPILEMAGERHAFISEFNYVYNMMNPINDGKVNAELQRELDALIRKKKPYQRLEKADITLSNPK
jgi:glycosyltransferase involved in cell wall biosynthesis